MFSAKVTCDSISQHGKRLTTFELRYPKFIHGEFMTHRALSRNASSSRAIPTAKYLEEVRSDVLRAAPVWWGKNQPGMQADEELDDINQLRTDGSYYSAKSHAKDLWHEAAHNAANLAGRLNKIGAHKQIVNRVLEPFVHINVVATATEWDNFFGLRLHKDAQPEMRRLAESMWIARDTSLPRELKHGQWHLPYVSDGEMNGLVGNTMLMDIHGDEALPQGPASLYWGTLLKLSVARCARVSYRSFETGKRSTHLEDGALFNRLKESGHWSPFEHQATPDDRKDWASKRYIYPEEHGNFIGWRQYRKMIPGEAVAPLPEPYRS